MPIDAPKIRRGMVVHNCMHIHGTNSLPYSQGDLCEHGFRRDCSGWGCEQYGLANNVEGTWGGFSTVTMLETYGDGEVYFYKIPAKDLMHGDVVAIAGPGTGGNDGHFRIFHKWANDDPDDSSYWAWEQAKGSHGPDYVLHDDLAEAGHGDYYAYRYAGILDDEPEAPPAGPTMSYTIKSGDTLTAIAATYRTTADYLYSLNRSVLDDAARSHGHEDADDGNLIFPGTVIAVPETTLHVVKQGETLTKIGARYGVSSKLLYAANVDVIEAAAKARGRINSMSGHSIWAGTVLYIP